MVVQRGKSLAREVPTKGTSSSLQAACWATFYARVGVGAPESRVGSEIVPSGGAPAGTWVA
jgi:hypothetical protein